MNLGASLVASLSASHAATRSRGFGGIHSRSSQLGFNNMKRVFGEIHDACALGFEAREQLESVRGKDRTWLGESLTRAVFNDVSSMARPRRIFLRYALNFDVPLVTESSVKSMFPLVFL